MTAPAPILEIHQLIDELVALQHRELPSEFELRRMRQRAEKLLPSSPADGHMALGIIACLEGRESIAVQHHQSSLRCGWNTERAMNAVVTLRHFYRHDAATQQALEVTQRNPLYLDAFRVAASAAYESGRWRLSADLIAQYHKRQPDDLPLELASLQQSIQRVLPMAERLALTDDQLAALQQPAWDLVRTLGDGHTIIIQDDAGDDGQEFLSRTLYLPLTFEAAQALNDQWVAHLAEQDDYPLEKFIITLREQETA